MENNNRRREFTFTVNLLERIPIKWIVALIFIALTSSFLNSFGKNIAKHVFEDEQTKVCDENKDNY